MRTETRKKHREAGLCTECSEPAYLPYTHCLKHLNMVSERQRRYYRRHKDRLIEFHRKRRQSRKDNGKCIRCGIELDEDVDRGRVKCQNCREGITYEVWI